MNRKVQIGAALVVALLFYHLLNPLRAEHFALLALLGGLWLGGRQPREFVLVFVPIALFGAIYDTLRLFARSAVARVSIAPVRELELAIFGWNAGGTRVGPVELLRDVQIPALDVVGALWYSSHVATILVFGVYLWRSERRRVRTAGSSLLHRFTWGFLLLNLLGFVVQVLYPVAPPWYVEQFGYVRPDAQIPGDPAGLARVDAIIGFEYFQGVYGRAAYVFGAMPSLHVAYPVWIALHARPLVMRLGAWFYATMMAFFAVYFTHHYVLDLVAGALLSTTVYGVLTLPSLRGRPRAVYAWLERVFLNEPPAASSPEAPT